MKFKLSTLGFVSLALYVIYNIWSSTNTGYSDQQLAAFEALGYSAEHLGRLEKTTMWSMIIGLLAIIPSIEFFIKAFKKHARGEEFAISTLSIVLTVLSIGMPFFAYAFTSFIMKRAFGSDQEYTTEKWGFWILSILSLGLVWVGVFLAIGPALFLYRKITEGIYKLEDSTGLEMTSLIVVTILTLGLIWLVIGVAIVFTRFFFVKAWNNAMAVDIEVGTGSMVWFWILSIITLGILPLGTFTTYWVYELFINNAEDLV